MRQIVRLSHPHAKGTAGGFCMVLHSFSSRFAREFDGQQGAGAQLFVTTSRSRPRHALGGRCYS